jgi:hypothetical protein
MAELDLTKPAALTSGIVATTVGSALALDDFTCNLNGSGTFSWLLQFDRTASTLKTGGARPVGDPTMGYAFDDEMITQGPTTFHVQPITFASTTPGATGMFGVTTGQDILMPIFLDAAGTSVVLLPLHQLRFTMGTLSASQDCIGTYNASGLEPANNCQPDATHPQFIDGASLDGFIALAEADTVVVSAIAETLCVLLSGNASMYGDGAQPVSHCKRDANNDILFAGDWCSSTNMPASGTCADSVTLAGHFAASSILITN